MDVQHLSITNEQATEHISKYSRHNSKEAKYIVTAARAVIEGKVVIDAHDVIRKCLDDNGIPKIAICPIDLKVVHLYVWSGFRTSNFQSTDGWWTFYLPMVGGDKQHYRAPVPIVPPNIQHHKNDYVLFEVTWDRVPDGDPILLSRLDNTTLFIVKAQWDMTELEAKVLSGRLWG